MGMNAVELVATVTTPFNPPHPNNPAQFLGISVEDVASYIALVKEDVGIHHEEEVVQAFALLAHPGLWFA